MRRAREPDRLLREFLQGTYEAGADLGGWDRAALEHDYPAPGVAAAPAPGFPRHEEEG